jgi:hypothetical protein
MNQEKNRKITVEDLLSLKKAERPPAEFWASFESEMRAKQLAVIVGRRSWWDGVLRVFAVVYRHHLPFGAVATLALTWVGVHYMEVSSDTPQAAPAAVVLPRAAAHIPVAVASVVGPALQPRAAAQIGVRETAQAPAIAAGASHVVQAPTADPAEAPSRTAFSYVDGVSLADFRETQPEFSKRGVFSSDREFETTVVSMRQAAADTEPLARLDPASEERRARLLGTALPTYASSASSPRTVESQRIKDDRMYESMDPYGSNGGMSLEFKF